MTKFIASKQFVSYVSISGLIFQGFFIHSVAFWKIENQSVISFYKQVISSSSKFRQKLDLFSKFKNALKIQIRLFLIRPKIVTVKLYSITIKSEAILKV